MKKTIALILCIIFIINLSVSTFAADVTEEIKVYVNDTRIHFDVQPVFIQSRTMVPIRAVFEAMGAQVEWDNDSKTVTVTKGSVVQVQLDNPNARVNGETIVLDVPATGVDGRILVPVRFISEALEAVVDWDNTTKTVFINENKAQEVTGNIQNQGRYATDGRYNFYVLQDRVLIREDIFSKKQEKISDYIIGDLHILGDWLYCIGIDNGINKVMRFEKNGRGKEIVINEPVRSIQISNGWIYFDAKEDSVLYRTRTDGTETMALIQNGDFSPRNWFVQNGWIYYKNTAHTLLKARINGTGIRQLVRDAEEYSLKYMDQDILYLVRDTDDEERGLYQFKLSGGSPVKISDKVPMTMNADDQWLYAAVKIDSGSRLIKMRKDGAEVVTINEYKENDTPKFIYLNDTSIYYTLLRGKEELMFQMSLQGRNITSLSWVYGNDYYPVRDVLTRVASVNTSLISFNTFHVTTVKSEDYSDTFTNEIRMNKSQSLYHQRLITDDKKNDLDIWMDKEYIYTKNINETHWTINRLTDTGIPFGGSVFDFIVPNQELCNNLSIVEENGKHILTGTGAFPVFMRDFFLMNDDIYAEFVSNFVDSVTIKMTIDKKTFYIEELSLELNSKYKDSQNDIKKMTSTYQFINTQFNNVYLTLPHSIHESITAMNRAEQSIENGLKKYHEGKYQDAVQLFDTAIGIYNKSYNAYLHKANAQYHQGSYKEAILTYEKYYEFNPYDITLFALQGRCYFELGDLKKAKELAELVLDVNNNAVAFHLLGKIFYKEEEYHSAYDNYRKAVQLEPENYNFNLDMVSVLFNMGSYTKCIETADEVLSRFPDDRNVLFIKARSLSAQSKSNEAIAVFEHILRLDPANDFVTMTYIGLEYESLQNFTKSQEYADRAKGVYADYSLLTYLIEKLDYERSTSSGQKLVNFIRDYYLYYKDSEMVNEALEKMINKGNFYTTQDVEELLETILNPDDSFSYMISGSDYEAFINLYDNANLETKQEGNTIYIGIKTFSLETGVKFTEIIQNIQDSKEKTLILDLRDNDGGLTSEANKILDSLLPECVTSYLIERDGYIDSYLSNKSYTPFSRIGILVNENTASSSELLALGLKLYKDNVTIIGKPTVGKGVGQIVYMDRAKKYALFLVNHYWNVLQTNINEKGLPIDMMVEDDDPDYSKALQRFLGVVRGTGV